MTIITVLRRLIGHLISIVHYPSENLSKDLCEIIIRSRVDSQQSSRVFFCDFGTKIPQDPKWESCEIPSNDPV